MSGQLHTPATLSLEKEVLVPIELEASWASGLVWTFWKSRGIAGMGQMAPLTQAADSKG